VSKVNHNPYSAVDTSAAYQKAKQTFLAVPDTKIPNKPIYNTAQ